MVIDPVPYRTIYMYARNSYQSVSLQLMESNALFLVAEKHSEASRTRPESAALTRGYNYRVTPGQTCYWLTSGETTNSDRQSNKGLKLLEIRLTKAVVLTTPGR